MDNHSEMPILTSCLLATGILQAHRKAVQAGPLTVATRIYIAPLDPKSGASAGDIARYLNRRALPAALLASLGPLKTGVSKANGSGAMNAILAVTSSPRLTLSVYLFKPTVRPVLTRATPVWTTVLMGTGAGAVNSGLDTLLLAWRHDHPERKRTSE